MVAKVAEVTSWMKIWDVTLDKGPRGSKSMLAMLFEITQPAFGSKPCPHCDIKELDSSLFHHLMETHPHDHVYLCKKTQRNYADFPKNASFKSYGVICLPRAAPAS